MGQNVVATVWLDLESDYPIRVCRVEITPTWVEFDVYEPSSLMGRHSTIMHVEKLGWMGDVKTRRLSSEIEALPVGAERLKAVKIHRLELETLAKAYVARAFPKG